MEEKTSKNTRKLKTKLKQTKLQDTGTLEKIKEKFKKKELKRVL